MAISSGRNDREAEEQVVAEPTVGPDQAEGDVDAPEQEGRDRHIKQQRVNGGGDDVDPRPALRGNDRRPIIRWPMVLCRRPPTVMAL